MQLLPPRRLPNLSLGMGLAPILAAVFAFNLGSSAWSAVVAGRLTQDGAGGAGGALGPWAGGFLADWHGVVPVLLLFAAGSALMLPVASFGVLPSQSAWPGWNALAGRGLPWQALMALGLASAADAGRAALVPGELIHQGEPLAGAG